MVLISSIFILVELWKKCLYMQTSNKKRKKKLQTSSRIKKKKWKCRTSTVNPKNESILFFLLHHGISDFFSFLIFYLFIITERFVCLFSSTNSFQRYFWVCCAECVIRDRFTDRWQSLRWTWMLRSMRCICSATASFRAPKTLDCSRYLIERRDEKKQKKMFRLIFSGSECPSAIPRLGLLLLSIHCNKRFQ